jgi:hypothetical protein
MTAETNQYLSKLPIRFLEVCFENSTKSKSLNIAMSTIGDNYDIAVIIDADNIIPPDYLIDINNQFASPQVEILQTHRIAKNLNNKIALLDAISEEINNSIFRLGHVNLGLSAALIGSGMAFRYNLFRQTMSMVHAVGGFDRELELKLLYDRKFIYYLPHTYIKDEKIQSEVGFSRQRRRWLSAQWHYSIVAAPLIIKAIFAGKWSFVDKYIQQISMPRLLLVGFIFIIAFVLTFINAAISIKWWVLFGTLILALMIAIPRHFYNRHLILALATLPCTFFIMAGNLFKLRHANKKFIHTLHGVDEK